MLPRWKIRRELKRLAVQAQSIPAAIYEPFLQKNYDKNFLKNVILHKGDLVIFESTVHPGATEEICGPELEKNSKNLKCGKDFFLGYSPERVNPGDKLRTIDKIDKVISGQNKNVEKVLKEIYVKLKLWLVCHGVSSYFSCF